VLRLDAAHRVAVHAHHVQHRLAVHFVARERAHSFRNARGLCVRFAAHQRRDGAAHVAAFVGVVRERERHQQRAEIGVAQAQWPELVRILRNFLGGIAGVVHQNFLRRNRHVHGMLERGHVKLAARTEKLHQVQRSQVARRIVQEHVFRARIRSIDARRVFRGMPAVDGRVVLHARIAAVPRGIRNLVKQIARAHLFGRLPVRHVARPPVAVFFRRAHEVVCHAHRMIRVLEEN
jgi:hypothetical protein